MVAGPAADPDTAAWRERLVQGLRLLPDKPEETPDATLRALWLAAAGQPCSAVRAAGTPLPGLDAQRRERLDALIARRLAGEPLAHITGRQHFAGLEMLATPAALLPRRETELLAREAIALAATLAASAAPVVADACTGSGNVALAVAHAVPRARVHGADLSAEAVALARENARWLGLDVAFARGDLLEPFRSEAGRIDLITCNPPYIRSDNVPAMAPEISGHEPRLAFDGGPLGVSILMRLIDEAPEFLRPGGWLLFEVGAGQGGPLARRLQRPGRWKEVRTWSDDAGTVRVLGARTHPDAHVEDMP